MAGCETMKAISQHDEIRHEILELMDLVRGKFNVVNQIEDKIHCNMRNKTGCLGSSCMYFKSVNINCVDRENRCYFSPKSTSTRCDCSDQYILLAILKLESHKRVEELISTLNKEIPEHVKRFRFRDKCRLDYVEIDPDTKDTTVVWVSYNCCGDIKEFRENIHQYNKLLRDDKMPLFEAFKRGKLF